ncbi:MAG: hypothetical protein IPJ33_15895 [Gammaproteobacteria bacterium]|nr:hypothetical protein [Gammaproteobacteria bacterium]
MVKPSDDLSRHPVQGAADDHAPGPSSGEYMMIKQAAKAGMHVGDDCFDEIHSGFRRCGVDCVIGYAPIISRDGTRESAIENRGFAARGSSCPAWPLEVLRLLPETNFARATCCNNVS